VLPDDRDREHDREEATIDAAREDPKAEFLGRCIDSEERRRRDRADSDGCSKRSTTVSFASTQEL
jgi:hypothetical protein